MYFRPIFGLIFLFKYRPGEEISGKYDANNKDVYFSQQVISNACATQAIVNLLLNLDQNEVKLGPVLENFLSFSKDMDPSVCFKITYLFYCFLFRPEVCV